MPGYKVFARAGLGCLTDEKLDMINGLMTEERPEPSVSKFEKELQEMKEWEDYANSRCLYRNEPILFPNEGVKRRKPRSKSDEQRAKEVAKRRKKNKNKKTHRKG